MSERDLRRRALSKRADELQGQIGKLMDDVEAFNEEEGSPGHRFAAEIANAAHCLGDACHHLDLCEDDQ